LKIISTLQNKQYIFDYATQYVGKHPTLEAPTSFMLSETEFNEFVHWLDSKDISYKTNTEEALHKFKDIAEKESYYDGIKTEFETLQRSVAKDKKQDLLKHGKEIKHMLQDEIVSRYYYLRGRLQNQILTDEEVKEAILVLHNPTQYSKLLSKPN
jgi:carboxyl-terminal processing protease